MIHRLRVLLVVAGAVALMMTAAVAPAFAAKGGRGNGGKHGGPTSSATLVVSPNPAQVYSTVQVSGCGYVVGAPAEIGYITPMSATVGGITVDSNGCIATALYVYGAGSYSVGIQQYLNNSWVVEASTTFTAQ